MIKDFKTPWTVTGENCPECGDRMIINKKYEECSNLYCNYIKRSVMNNDSKKDFTVQYHAQRFGKSYHQITSILEHYVSNGFLGKDIVIKIVPCDDLTDLQEKINTLFDKIKHGDQEHQEWLRNEINKHFELEENK